MMIETQTTRMIPLATKLALNTLAQYVVVVDNQVQRLFEECAEVFFLTEETLTRVAQDFRSAATDADIERVRIYFSTHVSREYRLRLPENYDDTLTKIATKLLRFRASSTNNQ